MREHVNYQVLDTTILLVYFIILGMIFVVWLAEYILQGLGMYRLAQAQGVDSSWMAFVPWCRTYLHGKIAGEIAVGKKTMKNPGLWMVLVPLVFGGITGGIFFVVIFMTMILGTIGTMGFSGGGIYAGSISMLIVLFIIWGIIIVAAIAYTAFMSVLRGLVNYQIYRRFHTESKAVLHMLLSIFVPLYQGIFFFMLRKRVQVEPKERKSE